MIKRKIMKAIIYRKYGGPEVLHQEEVKKPSPKDNEVLIRVKATAVNSGDIKLRKADPSAVRLFYGLIRPRKNILGSVFSGHVEEVGKDVRRFKVGDQVFGTTGVKMGTYAEYLCVAESSGIARKPQNISHTEAAVIPFGGNTALHFLRKAGIKDGQTVLVYGSSGAIGTAAVQIAKSFGAIVTAVCSTRNKKLVTLLGADKVIDYAKDELKDHNEQYDVVIDTVNKLPFKEANRLVSKAGKMILSAAGGSEMMRGLATNMTSNKQVIFGVAAVSPENMEVLASLVEQGKLRPVIDKTYATQSIQDAHRYVELGHKTGNVAVTMSN